MLTLRPERMGGSETYARGLTRALAEHGSLEYLCLVREDGRAAADGLPARVGYRVGGARAVHYPFTIPLPPTRLPYAVTLHDVLHHEELPAPLHRRLVRRVTYDLGAKRAERVIVPSAWVRERAHQKLGISLDRLRVVHYGIDLDRFHVEETQREGFLFYPAQPWPHKNHARLFEAFALLQAERPGLELVLTGDGFGDLPAGVRTIGRASPEELAALYRRAGALVFPSLYEGFGFPPLEAMASGCPVACSNAGSLPEICGDAAFFFDPLSVDEIAAAAALALDEGAGLVRRGLERAQSFTWAETAARHEAVYRELVA